MRGGQLQPWRRAQVRHLLGDHRATHDLRRGHHPAQPQSWRQRLRQAREMHEPRARAGYLIAQREQRWRRRTVEAQRAVRIILDQHDLVPCHQFQQLKPARGRQRGAGWIGEGRHRVDHARTCRRVREHRLQCVDVHAVMVGRHAAHVSAGQPQCLQRGRVGGFLHQHKAARLHQRAHEKIEALLGAAGDEQFVQDDGRATLRHQGRQRLAQRWRALRGAVLQALGRTFAQCLCGCRADAFHVEQRGGRIAAGERDHLRVGEILEQLADRRALRLA